MARASMANKRLPEEHGHDVIRRVIEFIVTPLRDYVEEQCPGRHSIRYDTDDFLRRLDREIGPTHLPVEFNFEKEADAFFFICHYCDRVIAKEFD